MKDSDLKNWNRRDDAMVEIALRRGASRRDLLRMFVAGGISLSAALPRFEES